MSKRSCTGKTKKGKRCKAAPLKDKDCCLAHADQETRESTGFGGSQPGAGRPRLPRPSEVAQQLIERNILALQKPYWRTLGYDVVIGDDGPELVELEEGGAKVYGESKDGDINVSDHEDLEAMQKAAERLQDRVYGRPKQATEITAPDGAGLLLLPPMDATEKSRKAAELLKDLGRVDAAR